MMLNLRVAACIGGVLLSAFGASAAVAQESTGPGRKIDGSLGLARDPGIAAALADIDPAHIRHTDSMLVSFGTRNPFSDTTSQTRGIGAARRWIHSELDRYRRDCGDCLRVEYNAKVQEIRRAQRRDTTVRSANIVNVVAWLPGRDTTHAIVMSGRYDSCVCSAAGIFDSASTAPGADDDGSGSSAVIELARVFSKRFPKGLSSSIIFVTVACGAAGRGTQPAGPPPPLCGA